MCLHWGSELGGFTTGGVVSVPGLYNITRSLRAAAHFRETPAVAEAMRQGDRSAAIAKAALAGECTLCNKALDLFVSLYGAEAGNVALRVLATGGIYLGGGISPKIIERLQGPGFMLAFCAKGRLSPLLENFPVRVIPNDRTALFGPAPWPLCHQTA